MRHKKSLIIFSVVFVALTTFVYCASSTTTIKRVRFKNQGMVINQGTPHITNERLGVNVANTDSGIQNHTLEANNKDINIKDKDLDISSTNTKINNQGELENSAIGFKNSQNKISNSVNDRDDNYEYNSIKIKNNDIAINNQNYDRTTNIAYQDIDWSTWKSNFVNKILDDSLYINSLDFYGIWTWFYYSFNVSDKGAISDIYVFSFYLTKEDKDKIKNLIKSYEYKPITVFPANTKRHKAKVKAVVLLGDSELKADPSKFQDTERIKLQY